MILNRNKIALMLSVAAFALWACSGQNQSASSGDQSAQNRSYANSAEDLLDAEGSWHMVEAGDSLNPLQKHLQARVQVDPTQLSKSKTYTSSASDTHVTEEAHFRVLRMEEDMVAMRGETKKLMPPRSNLIVSDEKLDQAIETAQASRANTAVVARDIAQTEKNPAVKSSAESAASEITINAAAVAANQAPPPPAAKPQMAEAQDPDAPSQIAWVQTDSRTAGNMPVSQSSQNQVPQPETEMLEQASEPDPQMKESKQAEPGMVSVGRVRTGDHPGKTRMVLDVSGPTKFDYKIDETARKIVIDIAASVWDAPGQKTFAGHPLLKSYTATHLDNGNTQLAIELAEPGRIVFASAMKPNEVHGNRIVFDLARVQ